METDWNKLIERYLQNELSSEGKEAFEFELKSNPELKMEVDLHLMIMGSAIRSAERGEILAIGKKFHLRRKLSNAAVVVGVVLVTAVTAYFLMNDKRQVVAKPKQAEKLSENEIAPKNVVPVCGGTYVIAINFPLINTVESIPESIFPSSVVSTDVKSLPKETSKNKEEKKQEDQKVKYFITTIKTPAFNIKSTTREDRAFYLNGNYTYAGDYMIMDTPEGLYMFDTCNKQLFVFKSEYRRKKARNGETVLFGFKHRRNLTDVYKNRIQYNDVEQMTIPDPHF